MQKNTSAEAVLKGINDNKRARHRLMDDKQPSTYEEAIAYISKENAKKEVQDQNDVARPL
jgi:hypothetical protein